MEVPQCLDDGRTGFTCALASDLRIKPFDESMKQHSTPDRGTPKTARLCFFRTHVHVPNWRHTHNNLQPPEPCQISTGFGAFNVSTCWNHALELDITIWNI